MKTLIIYTDVETSPKFLIVEGDYSRFHQVMINAVSGNGFEEEFSNWFFNQESGNFNFELSDDISIIESKDWDRVAVCTFLP